MNNFPQFKTKTGSLCVGTMETSTFSKCMELAWEREFLFLMIGSRWGQLNFGSSVPQPYSPSPHIVHVRGLW